MKKREWIPLLAIWLVLSLVKINLFQKGTNFWKGDDFGLFRVEEATRYRYAKIIAETGTIPKIDYRIQYPEGLKVTRHFTVTSQLVLGYAYRYSGLKKILPFHRWVILFMLFYSTLTMVPIFLILRLFFPFLPSLSGMLFYALSFPAHARTLAGGLVEEDIAIFPLFLFIYFFIHAYTKHKYKSAVIAAGLLFYSLAGWHVTQFLYLIFLSFLILCYFFLDKKIIASFYPSFISSFAAGILVPVLRGEIFLFSFSIPQSPNEG